MSKLEYDIMRNYEKYNRKTTQTAKGGVNFLELLTIVFVVLKLCKVIDWSWWWVLSPIWIGWGLAIVIVIIIIIIDKVR